MHHKHFRFTGDQILSLAALKKATGAKNESVVIRLALDALCREFLNEDFPPSNREGRPSEGIREIRVDASNGLGQTVLVGIDAPPENAISSVFNPKVKATAKEG
jgi:hypothetical protein